ncbi:aminoglycoside phosphotransferase family protein [Halorussus aquaticus]|uniref:Aminoglycoside phosphotransferase family protein n=1 Tax=Halorussus aquaticus TaxID=2953748 RepID=A0ABD5Q6M2_9EURY|nr:aminoglycoside phosphotransferase family protein [Halorussus aquaticus]
MTGFETRIRDALASHTSDFEVREELLTTDRHAVYEIEFAGRRAVCKLARDDATGLHRDAIVHDRTADSGAVPVPDLLARGEDHYVTAFATGDEYDGDAPRSVRERRLRDAGATLARVHEAFSFEAYGELRPAGDTLELDATESWPDLFAEWVADWSDDLSGTRFSDLGTHVLAFVRDHAAAFETAGPPVLVHGDYEDDNLRFAEDGVSSVLDWEVSRSAPGEFDLARAELGWFEKPTSPESDGELRGALIAGYESVRPLPNGFDARRATYRAALTLRPFRRLAEIGTRAEVPADELGATMESFVRDRLDAARQDLR